MSLSRAGPVVALVVILSLVIGGVSVSGVAQAQTQPDVDTSILRIELHENTSATWTLQIRTRLRTTEDKTEYRAFQQQFENDTSAFLGPFAERINGTVRAASKATGREMTAVDFSASTTIQSVPRQWGIVTYQFRWTNFSQAQSSRLFVGDVFQSGLFIAENDTLEVVAPEGYQITSATPSAVEQTDGVLTWTGPESFSDGEPRVVYEPRAEATPTVQASETPVPSADPDLRTIGGAVGVVFLAILVVVGVQRQTSDSPPQKGSPPNVTSEPAEPDSSLVESSPSVEDEEPAPPADSSLEDELDDSDSKASGADLIVTDEDHVTNLLRASGGRIRQKDVVTELGWSKSKVSRVLSRMEDDGVITKLRLGRENVIDLVEDENAGDDS
ncbi:helix-turn-helix transcriptional regulator [Haloferax sp. DFSO60]|uniref:helix-turn-helix transcriptional regulator n=1 Tax=Haloferax sp. DFSO60 TaxID=3388652 RepID=UPI00397A051E